MSTPPNITPPSLEVPVIDPRTGKFTKEWAPVILAIIKKLNGI